MSPAHRVRPACRSCLGLQPCAWVTCLLLVAVPMAGCGGRAARGRPVTKGDRRTPAATAAPSPSGTGVPAGQSMSREVRDKLLEGAMDVLGTLETYEEAVAFPQVFDRLNQWSHAVAGAAAADGWLLRILDDALARRR